MPIRAKCSALTVVLFCANSISGAQKITLNWYHGPGGGGPGDYLGNGLAAAFTAENPNILVNILDSSSLSNDEYLNVIQQTFLEKSPSVDLVSWDSVYPGAFADEVIDLGPLGNNATSIQDPNILSAAVTSTGKVLGLPTQFDFGLMYYRTDYCAKYWLGKSWQSTAFPGPNAGSCPPVTWDEFEIAAINIQTGVRADSGNVNFYGYVFEGKAYEGLTCSALEWVHSMGGGSIIEVDGKISINNDNAAAAFIRVKSWISGENPISPIAVLRYQEGDVLAAWQAGNAAFIRSWPYLVSISNGTPLLRGNFGIMRNPGLKAPATVGGSSTGSGTLGGWDIMVSKYSPNADAAKKFAAWRTGPVGEKLGFELAGLNPTTTSLLDLKQGLCDIGNAYNANKVAAAFAPPSFCNFDATLAGNSTDLPLGRQVAGYYTTYGQQYLNKTITKCITRQPYIPFCEINPASLSNSTIVSDTISACKAPDVCLYSLDVSNYIVPRPSISTGLLYSNISTVFYTVANSILSGNIHVNEGLLLMECQIAFVLGQHTPDCTPIENRNYPSSTFTVIIKVITIGGILVALGFGIFVFIYRRNRDIKKLQPFFLLFVCCGSCIGLTGNFFAYPSDQFQTAAQATSQCHIFWWFHSVGFVISNAALIAKMRRIQTLIKASQALKSVHIRFSRYSKYFAILLTVDVIILLIWEFTDPFTFKRVVTVVDEYNQPISSYGICIGKGFPFMLAILNNIHCWVLVWGNFICYQTRKIDNHLNESRDISATLFNCLQCFTIGIPILFKVHTEPPTFYLILGIFEVGVSISPLIFVLFPKLLVMDLNFRREPITNKITPVKDSIVVGDS